MNSRCQKPNFLADGFLKNTNSKFPSFDASLLNSMSLKQAVVPKTGNGLSAPVLIYALPRVVELKNGVIV